MAIRAPLILAAVAAALAGCVSFGEDPPANLLTLTPEAALNPGAARAAKPDEAIAVLVPSVPQALATQRIPVRTGATGIAYLKDALWVEPPNRLFRALLAETITVRTGRMTPDLRNFALSPDTRLSGRLVAFGLDAPRGTVIVTYDAALSRKGSDQIEARRFEASVAVPGETPEIVAEGLNRAANQVATEVADWVK